MTAQQTWGVRPTLVYCWPTVVDVGPTVNQRWANVSCLLGTRSVGRVLCGFLINSYMTQYTATHNIMIVIIWLWSYVLRIQYMWAQMSMLSKIKTCMQTKPANTKHLHNIYTTPTLYRWYTNCFVFTGKPIFYDHARLKMRLKRYTTVK